MYDSKADIEEISSLMDDIAIGKVSRNKNFYTLAKAQEYSRFKRAKLLLSIIEDLKRAEGEGGKIKIEPKEQGLALRLFNPMLKYTRTVLLSQAELNLIQDRATVNL